MHNSFVENVYSKSLEYIQKMPKKERKTIGQFFTPIGVAQFMASLFSPVNKKEVFILDPGAGSGILTAAVLDQFQNDSTVEKVFITCFESCEKILPLLKENLEYIKENSTIKVEYKIYNENYITWQKDDFNETLLENTDATKYDIIICNPPYKKIPRNAPEAECMSNVCYGTPNLYFLFMAMGLFDLDEEGEMVYIVPRSWTSGAYFTKFREYFLSEGRIKHLHLFMSRDEVFENESVLQETIIVKVDKSKVFDSIRITSSKSNKDFDHLSLIDVPYNMVVNGAEKYVYLVTNEEELDILTKMNQWHDSLPSLGLKMKTGLTVEFRNEEYLKSEPNMDTVPLLYSQHIKDGRVVFPTQRENEYISAQKDGLIQKNKNYLFVKRFTAKEEKRRFQCGIYLADDLPEYDYISTQNKLNFIESLQNDMSINTAYGLYVLFNSTIYDKYYRILDGSTQVNSTEVNSMPVPSLESIEKMGAELIKADDLSVNTCDKIIGGLFDVKDR
ncbi:MAG: N-6 DNA methylase [Clostridia bacterium]|nr:N-6 DNA methylase [Clostridia bacterium]